MKLSAFKIFFLLFVLVSILEAKMVSRTQVIMSTFITITVDEKNQKYIKNGFEIIKKVDNSISSYNKTSTIYDLNKNLFKIGLDNYSYDALMKSQRYYDDTDGYFDITIGSITKKLYRFGKDEQLPTKDELLGAVVGLKGLHVERAKACMEYGMQVDLGGMGKGFAVDKVVEYFKRQGANNAIIKASGDIRCLSTCKIAIQDPFSEGKLLAFTTKVKDLGITTSGNYNRYVKDVKNNHLIDPKTKKSQNLFISVTLIGALDSADLDAYATAVSVMPVSRAFEFLDSLGVGYIVMEVDKKITKSKNINKYCFFN